MRQRITYLLPEGLAVEASDIVLNKTELVFNKVQSAAEERRLTLNLDDLPDEALTAIQDLHELHIRAVSAHNYHAFSPAVSRVSPGLHVFLTPRDSTKQTNLCQRLEQLLDWDLECAPDQESFSTPPILSERFSNVPGMQFYHGPIDLSDALQRLETQLCDEKIQASHVASLCRLTSAAKTATYVDIDFDIISHTVVINIFWDPPDVSKSQRLRLPASSVITEDRLEVGILQAEKPEELEELSFGGFLTVVGDQDRSSPVLFSFPSRHHPLPADDQSTFAVRFQQPTGLHPKFDVTFPTGQLLPPKDQCALHAYWTLPSTLFIDRYQLSDPLFLASHNLVALRSLSGEQDLEAPDWAIRRWGSAALLELALPPSRDAGTTGSNDAGSGQNWTITIPTHLRYVPKLSQHGEQAHAEIPWPVVFWACHAEEGLKMSNSPFDRASLGYDGLFGPKTMFYHVPPALPFGERLAETLSIPIMDEQTTKLVPMGTMLAVLLGFGWICWKLVASVGAAPRAKLVEKKQQ